MATTMKLIEAIRTIGYSSNWGIWIEATDTLTPETPARIGQMQFENGGILDGMEFLINGEQINDRFNECESNRREAMGDEYDELSASELEAFSREDAEWLIENDLQEIWEQRNS